MNEPSMKQVWAGMAMMALLMDKGYKGNLGDVASDAWVMADLMEREESERDEHGRLQQNLR